MKRLTRLTLAARSAARRRNPSYDESAYERALAGDKNLEGADLETANFEEADLTEVNFKDANLYRTNFNRALLNGANLEALTLQFAKFEAAILEGASLRYAYAAGAKMKGANLRRADLRGTNFQAADLRKANLNGAKLQAATLAFTDLSGADLRGANLRDVDLLNTDLSDAKWNKSTVWPRGYEPPSPVEEHYTFSDPTIRASFLHWFGKSVVKDATGRPLVVMHGTRKGGFTAFDPAKTDPHQPGFYFTSDIFNANTYVGSTGGTLLDPAKSPLNTTMGVYRVYVKMERPFVFDARGAEWNRLRVPEFPNARKTYEVAHAVKRTGLYDGVIFRNLRDSGGKTSYNEPADVYVVFDPKNIKSATANLGTYDPNEPDIRFNPFRRRRSR